MALENQDSISRQRRYQIRKKKKGLCTICGTNNAHGKNLCPTCAIKKREEQRVRMGWKPKVEGGRGRPCIY